MSTIVSFVSLAYGSKDRDDYTNLEDIALAISAYKDDNFVLGQSVEVVEQFLRRKWPRVFYVPGVDGTGTATRSSLISERSLDVRQFAHPSVIAKMFEDSSSTCETYCSRGRHFSVVSSPRHTGPAVVPFRVNVLCKIRLVDRVLEEGDLAMDKLRKRFTSAIFLLKAEEENLRVDLHEIEKCRVALQHLITENIDTKSGLVIKDKFERCLASEVETRGREWRKMRLNEKNLQLDYSRTKSQQYRKLELRGNLHAIDIDKLLIENREKLDLLKQKTEQLNILKKGIGRKGQQLIAQKSNLNGIVSDLKNTTIELKQKNSKYAEMDFMEDQNMSMLQVAEKELDSVKQMQTYECPKVQSYLELEVAVGKLKKERDNWEKRCSNDDQTIAFLKNQIKQLSCSSQKSSSRHKTSRY